MVFFHRMILLLTILSLCSSSWAMELPLAQWYPLFYDLAKERNMNWYRMAFTKEKEFDRVEIEAQARLHEFTPFILATGKSITLQKRPGGRGLWAKTKFVSYGEVTTYDGAKDALAAALVSLPAATKITVKGPVDDKLLLQATLEGVPPLQVLPKLIESQCTSVVALRKGTIEIVSLNFDFPLKKGIASPMNKNQQTLLKVLPNAQLSKEGQELTFTAIVERPIVQHKFIELLSELDLHQLIEISLTNDGPQARFSGKVKVP